MLQIRDDDEADDHHEEPRGDLVRRDDVPCVNLIRVLPRTPEGGNVFRDPDEKGCEDKADIQGHPPAPSFDHGEIHARLPVRSKDERNEDIADVVYKVIRKEVCIDGDADCDAPRVRRETGEFQFENTPCLRDVAPHGGIHKARKEGDCRDFEECFLRIAPRADIGVCLK